MHCLSTVIAEQDFAEFYRLAREKVADCSVKITRCWQNARAFMAGSTSSSLKSSDIQGLKHFKKIRKLLGSLHEVGCNRDRANNRSLHMDEYCLGILLYMFNPVITSLRGIQQASELKNVRKKLGIKRASLGSLSESVSVFDPTLLKQIAVDLAQGVPDQPGGDFAQIKQTITAVDGSVVDTFSRIVGLGPQGERSGTECPASKSGGCP